MKNSKNNTHLSNHNFIPYIFSMDVTSYTEFFALYHMHQLIKLAPCVAPYNTGCSFTENWDKLYNPYKTVTIPVACQHSCKRRGKALFPIILSSSNVNYMHKDRIRLQEFWQ